MAAAQPTVYTKMGMMAAQGVPVQHRIEEGQHVYYKKFPAALREQMYRAYEKLRWIGVGIPFTRTREGVRMEGGTVLPRAVKAGLITKAMKGSLIAKIKGMYQKLVQAKWAHTDVKPQNIVIQKRSDTDFSVYLIDNDFALPFGQTRLVQTPGVNGHVRDSAETINEYTDEMGFNAVITAIEAASG